jgi:hypothetical protein
MRRHRSLGMGASKQREHAWSTRKDFPTPARPVINTFLPSMATWKARICSSDSSGHGASSSSALIFACSLALSLNTVTRAGDSSPSGAGPCCCCLFDENDSHSRAFMSSFLAASTSPCSSATRLLEASSSLRALSSLRATTPLLSPCLKVATLANAEFPSSCCGPH